MATPENIMKFSYSAALSLTLSLLYSSYSTSKNLNNTDNWLELCPHNQFCFQHPKSLLATKVLAIDSITGQLSNKHMTLTYDLGRYASQFNELTHASIETITIDGHQARLLKYNKKIALSIVNIQIRQRFSMLIEFKNNVDYIQAQKIFESIRFTLKNI